ncbi:MAG: TonB-dependent receptor [Cytophagales bacterium]|nr:TonB-dependent receptor [Cytophagales bacterium]
MRKLHALRLLSALIYAPLLLSAVYAQSAPVDVPALGEIVVTATRMPQPLADLVADVTIIDRTTIQSSGATGVADVLARVPGVQISRSGNVGSPTNVFLRGAESRYTAVFIDGVRVDSQSTGGASWQTIPLAQIDRIEVLRGPAAAVYGSDAIGGVIQLFTLKGDGALTPSIGMGLGTYNTKKVDAAFDGSSGAIDYSFGFAKESSTSFDSQSGTTHNPDKDGYRRESANAKLGLQISKAQRVELSALTSDVNSQYDAYGFNPARPVDDHSRLKLTAVGLNWLSQWRDTYSSRLSVTDSRDRYETTPSYYLTETNLRSYLLQNKFQLGEHLLTVTLERREDHLSNTPINANRSQGALALGYGWTNQRHTLQLNLRRDQDSAFGGFTTGSAAYGFALSPQWRATASAATAFRAPTLYQLFSEYGVSILQPETSRNLELGLRYAQGASRFSVVAYRNLLSNLINFGTAGACTSSYGCYANTAQAEYTGVTVSGEQQLGQVNLHASLDLQDPRNLATGHLLVRRAHQYGNVGAQTHIAAWTVGTEAQFSSYRYDDAANKTRLGGYSLINLYASTPLIRDWTFLVRVNNLTDKDYQLANTYTTPGRSFYFGLRWAPPR